jgi:Dyp-type peroxidase family
MPIEATSQHLRNAHELLLLIPLRTGFVKSSERLMSYPSRLRSVLGLLFRPTQSSAERTLMPSSSFIDALQNIYHFHYGVVEHLQRPHLILSATFDSSWESYFHNLVDNVAPFLDAIFSHCEGFKGRSCKDGYEAFASFIREHQVQSGIFYSAQSDLTVDDIRILRKVARGVSLQEPIESAESESAKEIPAWEARNDKLRQPEGEFKRSRERDLGRLILAMWDLRALFPDEVAELPGRTEQSIFDEAAEQLIKAFMKANEKAGLKPTIPDEEAEKWFAKLALAPAKLPPDWKLATLERAELQKIQGNILAPYADRHINQGLMVLLQLPPLEAHRQAFLKKLKESVTTADAQYPAAEGAVCCNVAFTLGGMRRLGLSDEVLDQFPKEFREGMEARSGVLGDVGYPNHPSYWSDLTLSGLQGRDGPDTAKFRLPEVDLVLILQAKRDKGANDHVWSEKHPLSDVLRKELAKFEGTAPVVLRVEPLRLGKDHFGLFDPDVGESQPQPRLQIKGGAPGPTKPEGYDNTIALGELLLGRPDKRDKVARCADEEFNPSSCALFKDGSFLVVRKLKQDRAAFNEYLKAQALNGLKEERVLERLVGRNEKGRTLVVPPEGENPGNNFDYKGDSTGAQCPFSAHVRKTNPRTEGTPRIMRRSFPYGPDYNDKVPGSSEQDRGLMFMAYNASIAQQYEVVQRWINGGNSTGTLSSRTDLLGGGQPSPAAGAPGQKPFIALCWGMYLFAPALDGLDFLAGENSRAEEKSSKAVVQQDDKTRSARAAHGAAVLAKLTAIKDAGEARTAWKRLLEEDAYAEDADALWNHLTQEKRKSIDTPYGCLVANFAEAQRILRDDGKKFSVRTYWQRLHDVIGEHYLLLDAAHPASDAKSGSKLDVQFGERIDNGPSYKALASEPNRVIRERFTMESAYALAHNAADQFLASNTTFDVRELARYVVAATAQVWFDLPEDKSTLLGETRKLLQHYVTISRYCFFPHPEDWQEAEVRVAGQELMKADKKVKVLQSAMAEGLVGTYPNEQDIRLAMRGALVGFVPATLGHIAGTIVRGFEEGELLALARTVADQPLAHVRNVLLGPLLKSIADHPVPTVLYRTALEGSGYPKDTTVVIGLQAISRAAERLPHDDAERSNPEKWLFGGQSGNTAHGCPARDPATGMLLGVLTAVARYAPLERVSPLRFSHDEALPPPLTAAPFSRQRPLASSHGTDVSAELGGSGGGGGLTNGGLDLAALMDLCVGPGQGKSLAKGATGRKLVALLGSEERASPMIGAVFWQAVLTSNLRSHLGIRQGDDDSQLLVVVTHGSGWPRHNLLVLDDRYDEPEPTVVPVRPSVNDLRDGARRFFDEYLASPGRRTSVGPVISKIAHLAPDLAIEAEDAGAFHCVFAKRPTTIRTASVPDRSLSVNGSASVGVMALDIEARNGVTTARHAVVSESQAQSIGMSVAIEGAQGTVVAEDVLTDSSFIQVGPADGWCGFTRVKGPLKGVLPGTGSRTTFRQRASRDVMSTTFIAHTPELPFWRPGVQSRVFTKADTIPGDSGTALVDEAENVVGFAHDRTGLDQPIQFSGWVWAESVFHACRINEGEE